MTTLRLRKREDKRLLAGHLWVYSNEVNVEETPLKGIEPGSPAVIESSSGRFLGHAYVNPHSLICARVTSVRARQPFSEDLLRERLQAALELRDWRFPEPYYRWVHGEGDGLPGLVVDRYDGILMVQITTAGMEHWRDEIVAQLRSLSGAQAICLCNDTTARQHEQLPAERVWVWGEAPERLRIQENGLVFDAQPDAGQKTGWFYDHRDSRQLLGTWVAGKRVLDLYSYLGGFALNAAAAGASAVMAIDSSEPAVAGALANANANGLSDRFTARAVDAVVAMRELYEAGERFDVVVLDPPAFVKRRKDKDAGTRHYALNNRLALRLLNPGGLLFSASCSQAFDAEQLRRAIRQGMPKTARGLQWLAPLQQAPDHPVHAAMPETLYLKGVVARLI